MMQSLVFFLYASKYKQYLTFGSVLVLNSSFLNRRQSTGASVRYLNSTWLKLQLSEKENTANIANVNLAQFF